MGALLSSGRRLRLWLKRLRRDATSPIRFFASGEYGERNLRPHYHAIIFGLSVRDKWMIDETWGMGNTQTVAASVATIAYVAGYTAKKLGWKEKPRMIVDRETGELISSWQPPFIQMSRRPGLGGHAREYPNSWRDFAIMDGHRVPVPRFLHESWKAQATPEQIQTLKREKLSRAEIRDTSETRLQAAELIALAKQRLKDIKRPL